MTEPSYDRTGAARQALQEIYRDYGMAGIDNETLLNQLLPDLLAGSPREAGILQAAAMSDVGSLLQTRIQGGMTPDAAVRDVAAVLTDRSALDANACLWVVAEYAAAIGHPVSGPLTASAPPTPTTPPAPQTPVFGYGAPTSVSMPTSAPPGPTSAPPVVSGPPTTYGPPVTSGPPVPSPPAYTPPTYTPPAYTPPTAQFPAAGPPFPAAGSPFPAAGTPTSNPYGPPPTVNTGMGASGFPNPYAPPPPAKKSNMGLIIGLIAAGVVVICVIGVIGIFALGKDDKCTGSNASDPSCNTFVSGSKSPSVDDTTPPPTPSLAPTSDPSTQPTSGNGDLASLIPGDLDSDDDCDEYGLDTPKGVTGLADQLNCTEPSSSKISGGYVDAYLFKNLSSLKTSLSKLNTDYKFSTSKAGGTCPPKAPKTDGYVTWHHTSAPDKIVGHVECYSTDDGGHVYIWSNEPELTLFVTKVDKKTTFATLHDWWTGAGCCRI